MATGLTLTRYLVVAVCVLGHPLLHVSALSWPVNGVRYTEYPGPVTWDAANAACSPNLAVFDDADTYKEVVDWIINTQSAGYTAWIGVSSAVNDPYARTVNGRVITFSNLWGTGANLTEPQCVKLQLDPDGEKFNYYTTWLMEDCDDTLPYICMDKIDPPCSAAEDVCPGGSGYQRSLNNYCVWEGPALPLSKFDAESYCKENGGGIIAIYNQADLTDLQNRFSNTSFNKYQPWNAVWTSLDQAPGEGAWRYPNGYITTLDKFEKPSAYNYDLLNLLNTIPRDVQYGSSFSASGWTIVYFPYFDALAQHNDAAWNLVDIFFIEYLSGGSRAPFHAYTVCEAPEDDFCLHNAYKVPFTHVTVDTFDRLVYQCWDNYTFADGYTRKEHRCNCDLDELTDLDTTFKAGCRPKDLCVPNPCDQNCVSSLSYPQGYKCSCFYGYRLATDGHTCVDIDECDEAADVCGLGESGACRNRPGTYDCYCYVGYSYSQTGKCEASSPFTSGTMELSFRLPACVGDYADEDNKKAIVEAIYDIAENRIFMSRVTVVGVSISPLGTMTIKLAIGGVSTMFDHSEIASRYEQMLSGTGLPLPKGNCRVTAGVYYSSAGIADAIRVEDTCSLYNGVSFCSEECDPLPDGPVCLCEEGFTGLRCDTEIEEPEPVGLSSTETALIAVVVVLFFLLIVVMVMVCYLWSAHSHRLIYPARPPMIEPVYGSKPPLGLARRPNPWYRIGRASPGFPQAHPPRPASILSDAELSRRRDKFREGFPIG